MTRLLAGLVAVLLLLAVACRPDPEVIIVVATPMPPPTAVAQLTPGAPLPTPTMDAFCAEYLAEVRAAVRKVTGNNYISLAKAVRVLGVPTDLRERECLEYLDR